VRLRALPQARGRQAAGLHLVGRVLVHQVVARVLQQQRDLAGALDAPARLLDKSLDQPQQRALARAVAAHQRHGLAAAQA